MNVILTKLIRVDPLNPDLNAIRICCEAAHRGAIFVFPTETVYGLGAYAFDEKAVKRIFIAKGRPIDNPLIVHIANARQLEEVVDEIPETLNKLLRSVWPSPLTVILRKRPSVPKVVTAGLETVAVRMPAHPVALKLIECIGPVAAPSANISGRPSPTTSHHILIDMYGRVDIILDAGDTFFGVESTIVDLTSTPPKLLRPGPIPVEKLCEILGTEIEVPPVARGLCESSKALAPGMKYRHYAPQTKLIVAECQNYQRVDLCAKRLAETIRREYIDKGVKVVVIASKETKHIYESQGIKTLVIGSRSNLYEVAKNLFTVLREVDRLGVDLAVAEGFEEYGIGLAIMNRLRKASGYNMIRI